MLASLEESIGCSEKQRRYQNEMGHAEATPMYTYELDFT